MATRIRLRRGTSVQWTSANPTLSLGEFGYETNTARFKIGDGNTAWNDLAYNDPLITLTGDVIGSGRGVIQTAVQNDSHEHTEATLPTNPSFNSVVTPHATFASKSATIVANNTATTIDTFLVANYRAAEYMITMTQGTKVTATKIMVLWDGTNVYSNEYAIVEGSSGAANATLSVSHNTTTITLSASSSDAVTTNVAIKAGITYIKA